MVDTLIKVDTVVGAGAVPIWIPIHNFELVGGSTKNRIAYLGFTGGSYGVLAMAVRSIGSAARWWPS